MRRGKAKMIGKLKVLSGIAAAMAMFPAFLGLPHALAANGTLEVFTCGSPEWQSIQPGDLITFQHGIGFGTLADALAERPGEDAVFKLDSKVLSDVFYEGITEHSAGFYGDRARVNWTATPGIHTVQSYWTHPNEGFPGDVCAFSVGFETPDPPEHNFFAPQANQDIPARIPHVPFGLIHRPNALPLG